jgi:hypothetical protein
MPPAPPTFSTTTWVAKHLGKPLGDDPPEQISATARGKRNHHRHRPPGPSLRRGG